MLKTVIEVGAPVGTFDIRNRETGERVESPFFTRPEVAEEYLADEFTDPAWVVGTKLAS